MKTLCYPFILVFAMIWMNCQPSKERVPVDGSKQEAEVKAALKEMWDAIEKRDIDRYAGYVHPDFTQFGENDSTLRVGKEAEVAAIGDYMKRSHDVHTEMIDPHVTISGDVAWVAYYWSDSGFTNELAFASHGKSTRIFVRENGKWLCIHGHYTLLPVGS